MEKRGVTYESPITVLVGPKEGLEARKKAKEAIDKARADEEKIITDYIELSCEKALCLEIDIGELKKALLYDRQQYEKGYADAYADAMMRCQDCKYWSKKYYGG